MNRIAAALFAVLFTVTLAGAVDVYDQTTYWKGLKTDTISERTTATGVTIDSVLLKDGKTFAFEPTETAAATNVITAAECGTTFFLAHATEFASTLPAISTVTAGCTFGFIVKAAPSGASYTVLTGNSLENLLIGGINELEVDTSDDGPYIADGDTITFADGVAVVGDYVQMISDGTSWYLTGQANADGGITLTQAD
jgi:hypothetical protein